MNAEDCQKVCGVCGAGDEDGPHVTDGEGGYRCYRCEIRHIAKASKRSNWLVMARSVLLLWVLAASIAMSLFRWQLFR